MSNPPAAQETPRVAALVTRYAKAQTGKDVTNIAADCLLEVEILERELSAAKAQLAEAQKALAIEKTFTASYHKVRSELNAQLATAREQALEEAANLTPNKLNVSAADMPHQVWMKYSAAIRALKTSAVKEKNVGAE